MQAPLLQVAVVGAGPAGMYVAEELLLQQDVEVQIDLFDRLPTPFGLLRYGVAPDHLKMKSLAVTLQRVLDHDQIRFVGNVQVGRDVTVEELREAYDVVVYTYGASTDRPLGVDGEELPGSAAATEFVNWYSGHPDVAADRFNLDATAVAVIGLGNVALDVTRLLARQAGELRGTDIPASVLEVFEASSVTDLHLVGRRGPLEAKFTHKELRELGALRDVDILVSTEEVQEAQRQLSESPDDAVEPMVRRNLDLFAEWSGRSITGAARRIHLHFWSRPLEIIGDGRVKALRVSKRGCEAGQEIPVQMVLRSVGYRGVEMPGVPFDTVSGTVPSVGGQLLRDGRVSAGEYVAGWIGRGATGVLGTNRADAGATVQRIVADALGSPRRPSSQPDLLVRLQARHPGVVLKDGWSRIDAAEVELGVRLDRDRCKIATWPELLDVAAAS